MKRVEAEVILQEAQGINAGPWIRHSYNVAKLAEKIAAKGGMDSEKAYVLGFFPNSTFIYKKNNVS